MSGHEPPTRVEKMIRALKNHPVIAVLIVLGIVVISIGDLFGGLGKIAAFLGFSTAEERTMNRPLVEMEHRLVISAENVAEFSGRSVVLADEVVINEVTLELPPGAVIAANTIRLEGAATLRSRELYVVTKLLVGGAISASGQAASEGGGLLHVYAEDVRGTRLVAAGSDGEKGRDGNPGARGADGGKGRSGKCGPGALGQFRSSKSGKPGGNGGRGEDGEPGTPGGDGGVVLLASPKRVDAILSANPGTGGMGGKAGKGGPGGQGGRGGSGCSGAGGSQPTRSNGKNGDPGPDGKKDGDKGKDGSEGSVAKLDFVDPAEIRQLLREKGAEALPAHLRSLASGASDS